MTSRMITESFMEALKDVYFSAKPDITAEFLRGECRLLSFLNLEPEKMYLSGELAKALNATTPRIAATLNSLEKKGFITRTASDREYPFARFAAIALESVQPVPTGTSGKSLLKLPKAEANISNPKEKISAISLTIFFPASVKRTVLNLSGLSKK